MKNEVYAAVIVPANESEDGESPTRIVLTEEVNGYCLFRTSYDGTDFICWHELYERNAALEYAVGCATRERDAQRRKTKISA